MAVPGQQVAEDRTPQQIQQDNMMIDIQMEALGFGRRENILTVDYPEKHAAFVPAASIERLAEISGTKENKLALKVTKKLNAWNFAWHTLADDGTAADIHDVNEGLGQTHRGRLQKDESVRGYTGEGIHRGGHFRGSRGGRGGGRGGGFVGRGGGRMVSKEFAKSVTRTRAVKGHPGEPVEPFKVRQAAKKFKAFAESKPARETVAKLSGNLDVAASVKRQSIAYGGLLATPAAFMANLQTRSTTSTSPSSASMQMEDHGIQKKIITPAANIALMKEAGNTIKCKMTPTATRASSKQHNVHDLTNIAEASAPVPKVHFAMPSLAEQKAKQTTSSKSTSSTTTKSVITGNSLATSSKSVTTSETLHTVDLMDLDVGEESSEQPIIGFTHVPGKIETPKHQPVAPSVHTLLASFFTDLLSTNRLNANQVNEFKSQLKNVEARSSTEPETTPTPTESPKKEVYTQAELVALRPSTTRVTTAPLKDVFTSSEKESRPKKPVHGSLSKHMAAARDAVIGEHISKCRWVDPANLVKGMQNLSLRDKEPTTAKAEAPFGPAESKFDPGAASRAYYSGVPAPGIPGLTTPTSADNHVEQGYAIRGAARFQQARSSDKATVPSTKNHSVATARAPYGGASAPGRAAPAMPAWVQGLKPATDASAAARIQYGGSEVLAPVTNSTQARVGRSKINDSGCIGMMERAKKGQDPMEKARQLGL